MLYYYYCACSIVTTIVTMLQQTYCNCVYSKQL
jgi:hypothetical protein